MKYLSLLMLAPLIKLIVSDFRHREVSVMWLGILAVGTVFIPLVQDGWRDVMIRSGQSLLLIVYMSVGIVLWGWFKTKKLTNPINVFIGLGDLIFFVILIPLLPARQYAYLMVACLVFSLVWWWCSRLWGRKPENIPFIATSGIVVGAAIILKVLFE